MNKGINIGVLLHLGNFVTSNILVLVQCGVLM